MQSQRLIGLDLPLKALIWEDDDGKTRLAYTDPAILMERYEITDRTEVMQSMATTLDSLTDAAVEGE
jgi:uncharacterized protein (DUF302 family)